MCENIFITACKMWALWPLYSVHNSTAQKEDRSYNAWIHFKTPANKTVISINHD